MILTPENYHSREANQLYMSVSQYKDFLQCESSALAKLNGDYTEQKGDCFLIGSYVHAAIEGTLDQLKEEHPEIFSSRGNSKGELKADYKNAEKMIETIRNDELCSQMLQGMNEKIITGELYGVKWKTRIDILAEDHGRLVDLKTVKSIRERYWNALKGHHESFVEAYGYILQMAVYSEIERLQAHRFERLEPFIVAVSKEDVPDKAVICFDDNSLDAELRKLQENLPHVVDVKLGFTEPKRCEKCRYCRQTKKAKIIHYLNLLEVV